jgi:hypothetical protein
MHAIIIHLNYEGLKMEEENNKAKGGIARAEKLSPERRKEISAKAVAAKKELASLPKATHTSADHPLKIGDAEIPCYVLDDGRRVLSQRGLQVGVGMSTSGGKSGEQRLATFCTSLADKSKHINDLSVRSATLAERLKSPIKFHPGGGNAAYGYEATVLADLCDLILEARTNGLLLKQQEHIAAQAEILVRGFARVGIIALIDEATGYQRDREKNSLAKILEAFVAKEIQPWVKTFDSEFYEEMFRLRGLPYPPEQPNFKPQYFGKLTNDVVYRRLAPGVLSALKVESKKADKKGKLHQHLSAGYGKQTLLKHLGKVVALMSISDNWEDFILKLDKIVPRYGDTEQLDI